MFNNDFVAKAAAAATSSKQPLYHVVSCALSAALTDVSSTTLRYVRHFLCWNDLGYVPEVIALLTSDNEVAKWAIMADWVEMPLVLADAAKEDATLATTAAYIAVLKKIHRDQQSVMLPIVSAMSGPGAMQYVLDQVVAK